MAGSLSAYQNKRNFSITPEPSGGATASRAGQLQFVIQKHWARQLHYDLRLEIDGVMKSWAVSKGPSLDPHCKRMAVQVEDHPLAYNCFEGQIPAGQYGAGKVIIWDAGYWVPLGDPKKTYKAGKLKFELHGQKLHGRWTLVRMHGREKERQPPWLLIKEADEMARDQAEFNVVQAMPGSVAHEVKTAVEATLAAPQASSGKREGAEDLPQTVLPQLAELYDSPPQASNDWAWELKFDGYRLLARRQGREVSLLTRNGKDWTHKMPTIAKALADLPAASCWLDGEVVVLNDDGVPDFEQLQSAFDQSTDAHLVYVVFDLLFDADGDLREMPWSYRRERLVALMQGVRSDVLRLSDVFNARPSDLLASACAIGFEGVIGKHKNAPYVGRRSADWIKLKCLKRQEFVIGGYTDPSGSREGFGSLLLGVHDERGQLVYAGSVGTGFSGATLKRLSEALSALLADSSPFHDSPQIDIRNVHWLRPELVAEVSFAGWTKQGRIRHSVFLGLRDDKLIQEVRREVSRDTAGGKNRLPSLAKGKPMSMAASFVGGVNVTHPERVLDPQSGVTKLDLVQYYAMVAPLMMEHLSGRPVALMRAPEGVEGELFFQKHLQTLDMNGFRQLDASLDPGHAPLMVVTKLEGLVEAAQMNVVEFHTWNAKDDRMERPDRLILDIDPGKGVQWTQVQEAAQLVKVMLEELGLPAFLKTSGGKGLHIVVPIQRRHGWEAVKGFSKAIVQHLAETIPARFVAKSGPKNREGRIFVDYLRNGRGATTASAWSARARGGMGISVPLSWTELERTESGAQWSVQSVGERLDVGNSVWEGYASSAVSLTAAMKALGYKTD
ncbi:DNA ligase D [Comamonas terrigena]|uniref:DNA ligase D n=1 Tax=Comamonas terrigena TaxID=32013 RepID=UPI0028AB1DF5|nr:DNA ligase D [Comamonas terrigena]